MFDRYSEEIRVLRRGRDAFPAISMLPDMDFEPPDELALTITADIYFRLRDAYLDRRRENDGHFSRMEKIAALTTAAVMVARPYEVRTKSAEALKINPLFALSVGFPRVKARFSDVDPRTLQRMAGWLDKFRVASSSQVLDVVYAARTAPFELKPHDAPMPLLDNEVFDIHMLVSFYDVLKRLVDRPRRHDQPR